MTDADNSSPRISVLLPTKNRKDSFERVLLALLRDKREYPNLEIVVIDGDSSDGTADVIRAHAENIVACTSIGRGLYAALNVGLAHSTGEWIRMMADDDGYIEGVLPRIAEAMREHPDCLGVGGTSTFESWSQEDVKNRGQTGRRIGEISLRTCADAETWVFFSHEAMFFRREPLVAVGGWDERFVVAGDVDLQFRLLRHGGSFFVLPLDVLHAIRHAGSITVRHPIRGIAESFFLLARCHQWRFIVHGCVGLVRTIVKRLRHGW